jgi:hypothetical protein
MGSIEDNSCPDHLLLGVGFIMVYWIVVACDVQDLQALFLMGFAVTGPTCRSQTCGTRLRGNPSILFSNASKSRHPCSKELNEAHDDAMTVIVQSLNLAQRNPMPEIGKYTYSYSKTNAINIPSIFMRIVRMDRQLRFCE